MPGVDRRPTLAVPLGRHALGPDQAQGKNPEV